ncbi:MAG TPA: UMP kinase [Candidatus Marinimicrobia bacterium]|jgi:uridylate kinase|nr:UMP kinase [Candidatus Neomarinimicrobiota bacterium]MDP6297159.1 UMP kinase [Candidatus Neomarinimicrobiota bacterium]MDP7483516.1 UMP kinase [Candidatus Neomarinimicrobiota bacterium]MDP7528095.1 UMP kinase [Candidatus Neomarinimicrobiota bacterium]MDP7716051.1 UMP kinase [Candidatus Neomarinimicrobiota bacterium]|tara:strand:+ start:906 stop:1625 length:720 start_codon:yes stop_codon:yes gene_type:complete
MSKPVYGRVLLKLSGEILAGERGFGVDPVKAKALADEVKSVRDLGVEVGVVIGGGNIIRGELAEVQGMDRVSADYLGMLATIINAITLQDALEKNGCQTRTLTAISISQLAEPYIRRRAVRHLEKGRVAIFAGGTGNPYFSTDTAAVLRATEIEAEAVMKGTKVDGVYDKDPMKSDDAKKFDSISYKEVIESDLKVMDMTAITMARENDLPIVVFDVNCPGNLRKILEGNNLGTTVGAL